MIKKTGKVYTVKDLPAMTRPKKVQEEMTKKIIGNPKMDGKL